MPVYQEKDIAGVRAAAQASAQVLQKLKEALRPGMSTLDLDQMAAAFIAQTGGQSAFLGYRNFPGQVCISINEEVVHGIGRAERIILPGDLVSLDVGVKLAGYYGDNAVTLCAGREADGLAKELLEASEKALYAGIEKARAGNYVYDIGAEIEKVVKAAGFSVVKDLCGHGCGKNLHEVPDVPNFATGKRRQSAELKKGMIICIEPMVNAGKAEVLFDKKDGWTVRSRDKSLSAHFEHQILIKDTKAEILTQWQKIA